MQNSKNLKTKAKQFIFSHLVINEICKGNMTDPHGPNKMGYRCITRILTKKINEKTWRKNQKKYWYTDCKLQIACVQMECRVVIHK